MALLLFCTLKSVTFHLDEMVLGQICAEEICQLLKARSCSRLHGGAVVC